VDETHVCEGRRQRQWGGQCFGTGIVVELSLCRLFCNPGTLDMASPSQWIVRGCIPFRRGELVWTCNIDGRCCHSPGGVMACGPPLFGFPQGHADRPLRGKLAGSPRALKKWCQSPSPGVGGLRECAAACMRCSLACRRGISPAHGQVRRRNRSARGDREASARHPSAFRGGRRSPSTARQRRITCRQGICRCAFSWEAIAGGQQERDQSRTTEA
jgi:hypothetical protein